ncbi:MAG: PLP-dependent aminotransferase family protein [Bacteroidota bacterium]
MLPWKTMFSLQKSSERAVYLQLCDAIITEIKCGILKPGTRLPGTRVMAQELDLNRQTVVKAYDELYSQGWFELYQSKGTFVSEHLPEVKPRRLVSEKSDPFPAAKTGYNFKINTTIHSPAKPNRHISGFHDGPDVRMVPSDLLSRGYKSILSRKSGRLLLSYIDPEGSPMVRNAIAEYLNSSRGLQTKENNILITRGTQQAMFLLSHVLFSKDDLVITAEIGFRYAELTFMQAGAKFVRVPVDDEGIDVDAVEAICKRKKIRALYVTSHHHYPTTVTLSASRRMKLLHLAELYNFIIIEDDYDYEFHYESSPILPLASADHKGMVVYIGSFSKTITPGIRMGYVAAPVNLINELAKLRMLVDVQGDAVMEQVIAELLIDGEIRRHMKKALRVYRERRDFMCSVLKEELGNFVEFMIPEGGLSIWTKFTKRIPVPALSEKLFKKEVALSPGLLHNVSARTVLNSTRMGFGWMDLKESEKALGILKDTLKKM